MKWVLMVAMWGALAQAVASSSAGCAGENLNLGNALVVNGQTRSFQTLLGQAASSTPKPIVFIFHGRTNPNVRFIRFEAEDPQVVQVYPQGLPVASGGYSWWNPGDRPGNLRDYRFFEALLQHHAQRLCLDLRRVYVVGYSLGASFASSLGCAKAGMVRAVGVLGGGIQESRCPKPVAAMVLHHPRDTLVSIGEGTRTRDVFLRSTRIRLSNQAFPSPSQIWVGENWEGFNCKTSVGSVRFPVVWCPHGFDVPAWGGPVYTHGWPANTNALLWRFFDGLP